MVLNMAGIGFFLVSAFLVVLVFFSFKWLFGMGRKKEIRIYIDKKEEPKEKHKILNTPF